MHSPSAISDGVPPYALALAERARSGGAVVVYAGAGISLAQPTGLPTGRALASTIYAELVPAFHALSTVNPADLVAIADAVAGLPGGKEALRQTSAQSADFKTAKPGYAHRTLAYLVLEHAIDVLTTNWDTCIERGAGEERLPTVIDARSLIEVTPPSVLKVHGCASRPDSLLLTSEDLSHPPSWVREQTHARLGSAVVVFMGIGDIAGYVKQRISEAINEVGSVDNIRVVAPDIVTNWATSQWSDVAPDLCGDHRIAAPADLFMEQLAGAYIIVQLGALGRPLASDAGMSAAFDAVKTGLLGHDSLTILQWVRRTDIQPESGRSVLGTSQMAIVLTALGHLTGANARLRRGSQVLETDEGPIEVLISIQAVPARRIIEEAQNRLQEYASRGEPQPHFLVAGGIGWSRANRLDEALSTKRSILPTDILTVSDATNILDGPRVLTPIIRHADEILAS